MEATGNNILSWVSTYMDSALYILGTVFKLVVRGEPGRTTFLIASRLELSPM
jgi:hypothetical protein